MTVKISKEFFARSSLEVARDLLGRVVTRSVGAKVRRVVITETAAHEGGAPHAMRDGMGYAPGKVFVMPYRGRVFLNIATHESNIASCVCIRAGVVLDGNRKIRLDGPAKLTAYLGVTEADDRTDIGKVIGVEGDAMSEALVEETHRSPKGDNCIATLSLRY